MSNLFNMARVEAQDSSGGVLAGAKLEFFETGTSTNLDTYSDDALTTANANPVVADSAGRWSAIFMRDQDYKVTLSDSADVLISTADPYHPGLDNIADDTIKSTLSTTGSSNAYALTVNRVITAYASGDMFVAKANFQNTGSATLNVTGGQSGASALGAKTIKKKHDQDLVSGDIENGQWMVLKYDGTNMQLLSPVANNPAWFKGADVASAADLLVNIDGNIFDVTGTTAITTIATRIGRPVIKLHFDGALTLTHDATNLILPGGVDITTAAGDEAELYEYASADWRLTDYTYSSGLLPKPDFTSSDQTVTADTVLDVAHGLAVRPTLTHLILKCTTANLNYAQNDEVFYIASFDAGKDDRNFIAFADATNITIVTGQAEIEFQDKSTFQILPITAASWRWVVRCWI